MLMHPPKGAQATARRALEIRATLPPSRRGGLEPAQARAMGITSGVSQARKIAAGKRVDVRQVARFFARHRGNYLAAVAAGKTLRTSKAIQAWDLWGGEPMRRFVTREIARRE